MDIQSSSIKYDTNTLSKPAVQDGTVVISNQKSSNSNKPSTASPNSESSFNEFLQYLDYSLIWKPSFKESKEKLIKDLKIHIINFKKEEDLKDKVKFLEKITFYSQRMLQSRKKMIGTDLHKELQGILDVDDTYFKKNTFSDLYDEITAGSSLDLPSEITQVLESVTICNTSALEYLNNNPVNIIFLNKFSALYTVDNDEVGRSDAFTKTILIDTYNEYTNQKRPLWEIASLILHETYHANNSIDIKNIYEDESRAYKLQLDFLNEFKNQNSTHKDMPKIDKAIRFYEKMHKQNISLWNATKGYTD